MTGHNQCAECGGPAPHRMLCPSCLPAYGEALTDDVEPSDPSRKRDEGEPRDG